MTRVVPGAELTFLGFDGSRRPCRVVRTVDGAVTVAYRGGSPERDCEGELSADEARVRLVEREARS